MVTCHAHSIKLLVHDAILRTHPISWEPHIQQHSYQVVAKVSNINVFCSRYETETLICTAFMLIFTLSTSKHNGKHYVYQKVLPLRQRSTIQALVDCVQHNLKPKWRSACQMCPMVTFGPLVAHWYPCHTKIICYLSNNHQASWMICKY